MTSISFSLDTFALDLLLRCRPPDGNRSPRPRLTAGASYFLCRPRQCPFSQPLPSVHPLAASARTSATPRPSYPPPLPLNTRFTPLPHIYPFPSLRPLKPHNFDPCLSNSHLAPPIQLCKSCPISAFICPRPHLSLNCLLITHITPWHA